jgi:hypothetical protein
MSAYQQFTSPRLTEPDPASLFNTLRGLDASAGVQHFAGSGIWTLKKSTVWTANQITAAQNVIDTAPVTSPQLTAQSDIDQWPIELKALVLTLIDQLNVIRANLPTPLNPISPAQALAAIRAKAGTL